jgi:hypothetical protein
MALKKEHNGILLVMDGMLVVGDITMKDSFQNVSDSFFGKFLNDLAGYKRSGRKL